LCRQNRAEKNLKKGRLAMKIKRPNREKKIKITLDENSTFLFQVAGHIRGYKNGNDFLRDILKPILESFTDEIRDWDEKMLIEEQKDFKLYGT